MKYEDFSDRLKSDCGITSEKLDIVYNESDSRCWTALIGKESTNIFVTFHVNRGDLRIKNFDILGNRKQMVEVPTSEVFGIISELVPADLPKYLELLSDEDEDN